MAVVLVTAVASMLLAVGVGLASTRGRLVLSPLLLFVASSVLFINIGFVMRFLDHADDAWAGDAVLSVSMGLFFVCIGWFAGITLLREGAKWPPVHGSDLDTGLSFGVAVATAIVVFGTVLLYFYFVGYAPLFTSIKTLLVKGYIPGLLTTPRYMRSNYMNPEVSYITLQGFMQVVRYYGLPIVAVWFLHFYRHRTRPVLSLAMVATCILLTVLTGQRWPLMYMLVTLIVYWSWTTEKAWLRRRGIRRLLLAGVVLAIVLSALLGRRAQKRGIGYGEMLEHGAIGLYERTLRGQALRPFDCYNYFPEKQDWLYGRSWAQNLATLLPGPAPSYPVTLNTLLTGSDTGVTAPPDFYTEAYINFGWPGVVAVSFLWGVVLALFQGYLAHKAMGLLRVSVLALMTTMLAFSSISGINSVLNGLIAVVFVVAVAGVPRLLRGAQPGPWQREPLRPSTGPLGLARRRSATESPPKNPDLD